MSLVIVVLIIIAAAFEIIFYPRHTRIPLQYLGTKNKSIAAFAMPSQHPQPN
jgi:hypothetical protein